MNDLKSIKPSFDTMPLMVAELLEENRSMAVMIRRMSKQLCDMESSQKDKNEDVRMDVKELCNYLPNHPAEQTIYGWTSKGEIPYHKVSKHLYFCKSEIDKWLEHGRHKSNDELLNEAEEYVNNKKNK